MKEAHDNVYQNRSSTFAANAIGQACQLLPKVLQPLGNILVKMRNLLANAYRSFEKSFNGSAILLVFEGLRECLQLLVKEAGSLTATVPPPNPNQRLNAEEAKQFDAVTLEEKQCQRMAEQEGGGQDGS